MLRLAKPFLDLALWRITPAQLPASWLLLVIVGAAMALLEVVGALLLPSPPDQFPIRVALSVALPLGFAWAILSLTRNTQRFLQTATALLGVGLLAHLILYPLNLAIDMIGTDRPVAIPIGLLSFVVLVWYLLASAHIWRAALESGLSLGIAISVGYLVLSVAIAKLMLPDV